MRVVLDEGAFLPERAHDTDAGLDLRACKPANIPPRGSYIFDTGVHVELPAGTCGVLISKSGLNVKDSITSTGLIDVGYSGSIRVKLYNQGNKWKHIKAGDKISQLVVLPCQYETLEVVDKLGETDRGENGFGSTGR